MPRINVIASRNSNLGMGGPAMIELVEGVLPYIACVVMATAAAGFIAMPARASAAFQSEWQTAAISSSSASTGRSRSNCGRAASSWAALDDARTIEQA